MIKWQNMPRALKTDAVKPYYDVLVQKNVSLFFKRCFDILFSFTLLVLLSPVLLAVSLWVVIDSRGGVFYRQVRVTRYGKTFRIFKFRTMVKDADQIGSLVTVADDQRVTRAGSFLRKTRLDETAQLFNVLIGDMSFVGTRPEVPKYVARYTDEMQATLLLRAGVTSLASIMYKDEAELLDSLAPDAIDDVYVQEVLPAKMAYNLKEINEFSFWRDLGMMLKTVKAVITK